MIVVEKLKLVLKKAKTVINKLPFNTLAERLSVKIPKITRLVPYANYAVCVAGVVLASSLFIKLGTSLENRKPDMIQSGSVKKSVDKESGTQVLVTKRSNQADIDIVKNSVFRTDKSLTFAQAAYGYEYGGIVEWDNFRDTKNRRIVTCTIKAKDPLLMFFGKEAANELKNTPEISSMQAFEDIVYTGFVEPAENNEALKQAYAEYQKNPPADYKAFFDIQMYIKVTFSIAENSDKVFIQEASTGILCVNKKYKFSENYYDTEVQPGTPLINPVFYAIYNDAAVFMLIQNVPALFWSDKSQVSPYYPYFP